MVPFAPSSFVRQLRPEDTEAACRIINRMLANAIYSRPMTPEATHAQLFGQSPPALFNVRWQKRATLGLLRVGELIGVLDVAVGLDSDDADLPDYQPLGLLRMLALPEESELVGEASARLFAAADEFWRAQGVGQVKAFHASTGYPDWQAGVGLLPADWSEPVRVLAEQDYRYTDRYYCFVRSLRPDLFEESAPHSALTLVFRGANPDRRYQLFFRRTELIGEARVVQKTVAHQGGLQQIAHLVHWEVDLRWRNQDIGRWMLRRMVNDAAQQSLAQMIVFVRIQQAAAMNLLAQHGFVEHAFRGYTLEKTLRA